MQRRAPVTVAIVALWAACGLWLESRVGIGGQLALGVFTCVVLAALLAIHTREERLLTLLVVCIASGGEVVGSLLWGLYTYRFENLPAFVPPGHGLVYLGGLALARCAGSRSPWLVGAGLAGVVAWGTAGLSVLPTTDVTGAIGCATLAAVLVLTRRSVYAGVFIVVAGLELYGTALGTWTWESTVPGLGLPQANPPSGVASGYVLFDVVALVVAPRLLTALGRLHATCKENVSIWPDPAQTVLRPLTSPLRTREGTLDASSVARWEVGPDGDQLRHEHAVQPRDRRGVPDTRRRDPRARLRDREHPRSIRGRHAGGPLQARAAPVRGGGVDADRPHRP